MLGGNEWKKDSKRMIWAASHQDSTNFKLLLDDTEAHLTIILNPMQIRTFIVSLVPEE